MAKLISTSKTIRKSINWLELSKNAEKASISMLNSLEWEKIRELHILGSVEDEINCTEAIENGVPCDKNGFYLSTDKSWLLIIGAPVKKIADYISHCSDFLKTLDVRFTSIGSIDLTNTTKVTRLELSNNQNLQTITGLSNLSGLSILNFNNTLVNGIMDLSYFSNLYAANFRETQIEKVSLNCMLSGVNFLDITNDPIDDLQFLKYMPSLRRLSIAGTNVSSLPSLESYTNMEMLNISNTQVRALPDLSKLIHLRTINLANTLVDNLDGVFFPISVRGIILRGTSIKELPDNMGKLKNLHRLNLADMQLEILPMWLNRLNLEFTFEEKLTRGINLYNTQIKNVDMDIFNQPRPVIDSWFQSKEKPEPSSPELNECKVIFLGDGGAGKSLTIQRIMMDGEGPTDFSGDTTPGISITTKSINISEKNVHVHFWDFGGQEILHSMHRMFLTKRTLYVVLVNARDNTQDERARYWLHNIKSFANGSPTLLVLNQIDQNPCASVNEVSLRNLYPQLTNVIKLSAKDYTQHQFSSDFEAVLCDAISQMSLINEPFLPSWKLLKAKLQGMTKNYIYADEYLRLCEECGVENMEIQNSLLEWFGDLGISFCYRGNSVLSEFTVLRPDWITNAIYMILFNSAGKVSNGLIKHESIYEILHPLKGCKNPPKSVLSTVVYTTTEIEYVLGVIRKFRLSYRMDDETEFIPMLCERNEKKEALSLLQNHNVLELHMNYKYLPNNVLHRLMVEMRSNLDFNNVWLTGAIFEQKEMVLDV